MDNKYIQCEIKFRVLENEKPDFNKFLAYADMSFIFYLDERFKKNKTIIEDKEIFILEHIEYEIVKHKFLRATILENENFNGYIVVEPYVVDENGIEIANVNNFKIKHAQSSNLNPILITTHPLYQPNGMRGFEQYVYFAEKYHNNQYMLHYTSTTMDEKMKAYCYKSIGNNKFIYRDDYLKKQEELKQEEEFILYKKLKQKYES